MLVYRCFRISAL